MHTVNWGLHRHAITVIINIHTLSSSHTLSCFGPCENGHCVALLICQMYKPKWSSPFSYLFLNFKLLIEFTPNFVTYNWSCTRSRVGLSGQHACSGPDWLKSQARLGPSLGPITEFYSWRWEQFGFGTHLWLSRFFQTSTFIPCTYDGQTLLPCPLSRCILSYMGRVAGWHVRGVSFRIGLTRLIRADTFRFLETLRCRNNYSIPFSVCVRSAR